MTTPPQAPSRRSGHPMGALAALLSAHAISQTGNVVTAFAIPFYVLATGGSGVEVGIAAFFATAPVVIGGPFGGVIVDRIGHRRASIIADLISGIAVLAIPLAALSIGLPFWGLLALVFLAGILDTPGQTARRVMLPGITASAGIRIERSVGLLDGSERFAKLIGASIAGLLVAIVGPMASLFVNAATFAVSALLTWRFVSAAQRQPAHERPVGSGDTTGSSRTSYWGDLAEGFRWVARDHLMKMIVGLVLVTNLFDAARTSSLLPLYAHERLGGAAALGLLVAVMGGCALAGNVGFGFVAHKVPRRVTFAICFALAGGPSSVAFALGAPFPVLIAVTALQGLAAGAINPILGAVQLERVPEHMRGRVFGLINAGAWAGMPLGAFLGGLAADTIGLGLTFGIIAVLYTLVTLSPLSGGAWREMERQQNPLPKVSPSSDGTPQPDPLTEPRTLNGSQGIRETGD